MSQFRYRSATLDILKFLLGLPVKWWRFMQFGNDEFRSGPESSIIGFIIFFAASLALFFLIAVNVLLGGWVIRAIVGLVLLFDLVRFLSYVAWYHTEGPGSERRKQYIEDGGEPFEFILVKLCREQWKEAKENWRENPEDRFPVFLFYFVVFFLGGALTILTGPWFIGSVLIAALTIDLIRYLSR